MKVINNHTQPIPLDSGVVLAAAGTNGSSREVEALTERDRKLETRGLISVLPASTSQPTAPPDAGSQTVELPSAKSKGGQTK